uniref:G-protein coupled receptors family 1 profile domain-containing protein n=1 Tax=Saimiri boliviensis boliviensis TaxID=39432 RepID=A0A2K6SRA2_SAIBB
MADAQNISLDSPGSVGAIAVPVVFAFIFLLGTAGNGLVLAVLLQPGPSAWQEPGSTTDLFILNLAVADLCFILCCVPFQAAIYTLDAWLFGALVCKAVHLLIYLTMYASSFTLAAVSVDRYLAVRHPLRSRALRTPRNARAAVGLVWLLAALFSAPYLSYYSTVRYGALELCVPAWEDARRRALDVATFAAGYLLPVTVVSLAYGRTLRFLWASVGPPRRGGGRAMLAVAALYALCWGPHHALILCFWYGRFAFSPATYACRLASHCLAYANSCLNPLVYALASRHFRARFPFMCERLLGPGLFCRQEREQETEEPRGEALTQCGEPEKTFHGSWSQSQVLRQESPRAGGEGRDRNTCAGHVPRDRGRTRCSPSREVGEVGGVLKDSVILSETETTLSQGQREATERF